MDTVVHTSSEDVTIEQERLAEMLPNAFRVRTPARVTSTDIRHAMRATRSRNVRHVA